MREHWVGTWAAAPQPAAPADLPPPPFMAAGRVLAGGTLRQSARVSIGGRRLRLWLSNDYGDADLTVAMVAMALPAGGLTGGSAIRAGTSRAVTFGGQTAVRIPAGARAVSDPVDFPLAAGASVTVTMYLPAGQASGGITCHPGSRTTSYMVPGNHAADQDLAGAAHVDHWYFLTGVDVWAAGAAAAVMLGDSLTDGRGSTTNGNDRWPDLLSTRLRSRRDTARTAIVNQAIGGNRVLRDGLGPHILARLDGDALAVGGVAWLVVFAGVNDIGTADGTQAAQKQVAAELIAAYELIAARAHARGVRVYGATITPFGGSEAYGDPRGHREAARRAVNGWIRAGRRLDAVLDFDRAVRDPLDPRQIRPSLHCGDHLHLNPAGYQVLADAVPVRLLARTGCPDGRGR